jgi:hypothetical protein
MDTGQLVAAQIGQAGEREARGAGA